MEDEQRIGLIAALGDAYIFMTNSSLVNFSEAYETHIEPLLEGVAVEDRLRLADTLRNMKLVGDREYSLKGLAFYLDPQVGGS